MRWLLFVVVAACSTEIAVVPRGGLDRAVSAPGPVILTAFSSEWNGNPDDLTEYITPIAVELYNSSPYEVRVSYGDFALNDERGFRYAAINPFVPASQLSELEKPVLLAARGGGGGGGGRGGGGFGHSTGGRSSGTWSSGGGGHGIVVGPPSGRRSYGYVGGGRGWSGYTVHGGLRGWYPGLPYWRDPWLWGGGVIWWGPGYYPDRPSRDVIDAALPEGVLSPGGRVNGYLYFQKATDRSRNLGLTWEAHDPRTNTVVGMANVALEVRER
jgi:hypothetical protein